MTKIKQYRIDHPEDGKPMTQKKLAEKLHVTVRAIQYWESGKRTPHPSIYLLLDKLAEEYKV